MPSFLQADFSSPDPFLATDFGSKIATGFINVLRASHSDPILAYRVSPPEKKFQAVAKRGSLARQSLFPASLLISPPTRPRSPAVFGRIRSFLETGQTGF